jgi:hypothetical protein
MSIRLMPVSLWPLRIAKVHDAHREAFYNIASDYNAIVYNEPYRAFKTVFGEEFG